MKKDNKGITLIALVVTIIVLLILAGITIATLTDNQNGIFTNAKRARSNTAYSEADEKCRLTLSAIQTEIAAGIAADSSYNATYSGNITTLNNIVKKDLSGTEWNNTEHPTSYPNGTSAVNTATDQTIDIYYYNSALYKDSVKSGTPSVPGHIHGTIVISKQLATYSGLN